MKKPMLNAINACSKDGRGRALLRRFITSGKTAKPITNEATATDQLIYSGAIRTFGNAVT